MVQFVGTLVVGPPCTSDGAVDESAACWAVVNCNSVTTNNNNPNGCVLAVVAGVVPDNNVVEDAVNSSILLMNWSKRAQCNERSIEWQFVSVCLNELLSDCRQQFINIRVDAPLMLLLSLLEIQIEISFRFDFSSSLRFVCVCACDENSSHSRITATHVTGKSVANSIAIQNIKAKNANSTHRTTLDSA